MYKAFFFGFFLKVTVYYFHCFNGTTSQKSKEHFLQQQSWMEEQGKKEQ